MKAIKKEVNEKGHIILTCEESEVKSSFFGLVKTESTKETKFIATEQYVKGYWNWRLLPNKTLIGDNICFQLNSWCKDFD
jgi:hypothetical protein